MAQNYNLPDDWRERLATTKKAAVTTDDKLKLLDQIKNHVGSLLGAGTNHTIFNAIVETIRAQKNSAPVVAEAPSNPGQSSEASASIAPAVLERKIGQFILRIYAGRIELSIHTDPELLTIALVPDEADQLAHTLAELADDVRQDAAARAWSQQLLKATAE